MEIRNSRVCVVGGAGMLGSHLADHLINDRDCEVLVLDNLVAGHKKFIHPKAKFTHHDITHSEDRTRKLFKDFGAEYVLNYAAMPFVPDSYEHPVQVAEINAMAALKVMNAAQEAGVKRILQVSSAEIYGKDSGKKDEAAIIEPHSSYGVAKVFADGMVQVRFKEAGCPVIALRQFNCYSGRSTHPYVIPEIISQLSRGPFVLLGNNSTRDFQYAEDAVKQAVLLLERGELGEVYNMGSEESIKIYDLVAPIAILMGHQTHEIVVDESRKRPWEIWHLQSDNTKLRKAIGPFLTTPFEEGLRKTIQYFRENGDHWDFN